MYGTYVPTTRAGRYQKKMTICNKKCRLKVVHKLKLSSSIWLVTQTNTLLQVGWHLSVLLTSLFTLGMASQSPLYKSLKMYTLDQQKCDY